MSGIVERIGPSGKVTAAKERLLSETPRVDVQKLQIQLDVYKTDSALPAIMKRAKVLDRLCREKRITIDDNPLVGTLTSHPYGAYPIPEFGSRWMKRADSLYLQRGAATPNSEEREWIDKAADFWANGNVFSRTRDIVRDQLGVDIGELQKCGLGTELTPSGFMQMNPDFQQVLTRGLTGFINDAMAEMAKIDIGGPEGIAKWAFYKAALTCLGAVVHLAERYASLAERMASEERDPAKRDALKQLAEVCHRVPANPARTFREALQSVWFVTLGVWMEAPFVLNCPPSRFPQYMYPLYKNDKESGRITEDEAIELIQFYFLRLNSLACVQSPHGFAWSQSRIGQHLCIGGLTAEGQDATNEVDWLVLEAQRQIRMPEPLIDLLYHPKLPTEFLVKCVDLIRTGIGQPAFYDLEKAIQSHLYHEGLPLPEARVMSIVGCVQTMVPGYSCTPWEGGFNVAKMIELALNDGKDPLSGVQLGLHTGDALTFGTYDEVFAAMVRQLDYCVPLWRTINRIAWNAERDFPVPFASAVTNDCIKKGKDAMEGGAKYYMANGTTFVGAIDAANSLAAIKKLVFEEKKLPMKRLMDALAADFKGYEEVQRMCWDAPKYGNDDNYVDSIAKQIYEVCYVQHQKLPDFLGNPTKPEAYSVTIHFAAGRFTGALPYGRKAHTPLTDATVSATPGTDTHGPTALVKSAAVVIDTAKWGGNHFNMKFLPSTIATNEGTVKLLALIRTYFDLGGFHVQFNCVSNKVLREAQLHPENYKSLVVRVAGFSAFFIHLDKEVQDEIIKRTELSLS